MKMKLWVIVGMLVLILAMVGAAQAAPQEASAVFTTPYNGTLVFCLSTNPPQYNNCVEGYRQIRIYAPDPAHNNELFIQSCFQFGIWICDASFWMTVRDWWYTETSVFPHLQWTSNNVVLSFSESPETWNKLLMGRNKYIPATFGIWSQQDPYPGPEKMEQSSKIKPPAEGDKRAYP